MSQLQSILAMLSDLETAAHDLSHYLPRQWADIVMCRDFVEWLKVRGIMP